MAVSRVSPPAPFGALTIHRVVTKTEAIREAYIDWNTRRKTVAALNALSTQQLNDIGLNRGDISQFASRNYAKR